MCKFKILFFSFFVLWGCSKYPTGDLPTDIQLRAVPEGAHKNQIVQILGVPSFEDNQTHTLIYARSIKENRAFMLPSEVQRDLYVFELTNYDTLKKFSHITLDEGRTIAYDSATSPSKKTVDTSIITEIVNNFGKYDTGATDSIVR